MKRSPAAAFWLSLIPGVGHVYLGQTSKGLVLIALTAGCIHLADRIDVFGIVVAFIWIATMLDAHRSAQEINHRIETGREPLPRGQGLSFDRWWGWALIGLGVLFGLDSFDFFDMDWIWRLWPLGFIGLGVYILRRPLAEPRRNSESDGVVVPAGQPAPPDENDGESEPTHD